MGQELKLLLYTLPIILLSVIAWLSWFYTPEAIKYSPAPANSETSVTIGRDWKIQLSPGWEKIGFAALSSGGGSQMEFLQSTVSRLAMGPRMVGGAPAENAYTSTGYARSVLRRTFGKPELLWSRYIELGNRRGAETCARMLDGRLVRAFCLVDKKMNAVEMKFTLRSEIDSEEWRQAENIFASLTSSPATPTAKTSPAKKIPKQKADAKSEPATPQPVRSGPVRTNLSE
jgi:hypothetical protein